MENIKRKKQKEETARRIIKTAFKVYSEHGFKAPTSLIAKEAGVAHGSVFLHFPTLDDLLIRLVKEFSCSVSVRINELSQTAENIDELLNGHLDILSDYENFYCVLITETTLLPGEAKAVFTGLTEGLSARFDRLVTDGIEDGTLKRLPANILFNAWIGLVHYYIQNKTLFPAAGSVLKRYKKQLIFTYCELIRKQ